MAILDILFGRPLATSEEGAEHVGPASGVPIFGLDALSSAAYGPEAALTLLIPLGLAGVHYIVPITAAILALLIIVFFSYCQTIDAYPHGGGSYTVASENLGPHAGLLAASALMIDYVLTAAVGISAGVGALVSAVPSLQPHILGLCLLILIILSIVNMRGVREAGVFFTAPTYLFIGTLLILIVVGLFKAVIHGGHPSPIVAPPALPKAATALSFWLLLKVFSSGCTAMTGVEAVSNGTPAFRDPNTKTAKTTLTIIIATLIMLLAGIALLCRAYGVGATDPNGANYQSVLSMLLGAVMGRGWFYYLTIAAILLVLSLSANTAFADFPRLTRAIALDDYLPHVFIVRGRRLLYSHGVYALIGFTALLLIIFRGVTDRLIPLYAIGAFTAFTLSQAGMVMHWKRAKGPRMAGHIFVNGLGAIATGITTLVVLVAKFIDGAWITAIMIPLLIFTMMQVKKHYQNIATEIEDAGALSTEDIEQPLVVIPFDRWSRITEKAIRFALMLSDDIHAIHVDTRSDEERKAKEEQGGGFRSMWQEKVEEPLRAANLPVPELVIVQSPFRFVVAPVVDYIIEVECRNTHRQIAVLVPELVVRRWYQNLLHNHRAQALKLYLLLKGNQRIVVINIPWYLDPDKGALVKLARKPAPKKKV
jgi:amino acid transporter